MLRARIHSTFASLDKCLSCAHCGGVANISMRNTHSAKTARDRLRNADTNLNHRNHVLHAKLDSSFRTLNVRKNPAMPKNRVTYVTTGKVLTYHDILQQIASNNRLAHEDYIQFVEVQKVYENPAETSPTNKNKTSKNTVHNNNNSLSTNWMQRQKTLAIQQYAQFATSSHNSLIREDTKPEKIPPKRGTTENSNTTSIDEDKSLQKYFPQPKYSLNHVFITLAQHFADKSYQLSPKFRQVGKNTSNSQWECSYALKWPKALVFSALGATKQEASTRACMLGLQYLYNNKHITNKNLPIIPGQEEEAKRLRERIDPLVFKPDVLRCMQEIVDDYQGKMLGLIQHKVAESDDKESLGTSEEIWPVHNERRQARFHGLEYYQCREVKVLPITEYKQTVIETIRNNRVIIIKGEPGCGKSTRVPQYILEGWAHDYAAGNRTDSQCRIIVTQPRRIAAISLAERVASERNEHPGATIGYQVRLKSNFNRHTGKVLYCTTGILLRRLQTDPNLTDCTHVVLDEAHERDVNTDLLMNLLKGALDTNPNLKLLVMSATIRAEVFQEYFEDPEQGLHPAIVHIPGFTYPVEVNFLDGPLMFRLGLDATKSMSKDAPNVVYEDVVKVLRYIHKNRPEGAILVFLPGWDDILKVKKLLPDASRNVQVLCLHSRMPDSEQRLIFHNFPPGVRKIILATNIAETSVTIDDVAYVVDSGIQKENRFDVEKGINIIDNHWISKASMAQRKGRAGRVAAGEAFLMYSKDCFEAFHDYSLPEIQRTSLTKIVLDSKVYSNNMKAFEFLEQLITPPEDTAIDNAVDELVELELLDEAENLTPLGRVISDFQLEPKLAKALVNSVIYKCVTPIVDIVTYFSAEMEVFSGGLMEREAVNKSKRSFSASSDHLSMMRLLEEWLEHVENGDQYAAEAFCRQHNILDYKLRTLQQLRNIHFDYLHKGLHDCLPLSDDYSDSDELVKAVLLSGVGTVLTYRDHDIIRGKARKKNVLLTRHNHKATISSDSVNHKRGSFPTNYLLYINETRSNIRRMTVIRETSLVTPLTVLLFKNHDIVIEPVKTGNTENLRDPVIVRLDGTQICFLVERDHAVLLQQCKNAVTAGVDYYIYQLTKGAEYDREVNRVWDGILNSLHTCLQSGAQKIAF